MPSYVMTKLNRVHEPGKRVLTPAVKLQIIQTLVQTKYDVSKTSIITRFSRPTIYKCIKSAQAGKVFKQQKLSRVPYRTVKNNPVIHRFVERVLNNNPTLFLSEIKRLIFNNFHIIIDESYISRMCTYVLKFKRRKIKQLAIKRAQPRVQLWRRVFCNYITQIDSRRLIFIDECHFTFKDLCRKYGRSQTANVEVYEQHVSKKSYSLIAAMSQSRIVYYEIIDTANGNVTAETYASFFNILVTRCPRCAVFVQDNATVHFSDAITALNKTVVQTSPYSADYNPIELLFNYTKALLKKYNFVSRSLPSTITHILNKVSKTTLYNFVEHCKFKWIEGK